MAAAALWVSVALLAAGEQLEPEHAANPVYKALLGEGIRLEGTTVRFPEPVLHDSQSAGQQREALRKVAGSDAAVDDLLRNSVTAPQILRLHDERTHQGSIVRSGTLWFVVHADLATLDPEATLKRVAEQGPTGAGNMRFETRLLPEADLKAKGLSLASSEHGQREWYAHVTGRLLDRIGCEATSRSYATRTDDSVVVASRTASEFDHDPGNPNRWWSIEHRSGKEVRGSDHAYAGGASYVKISRLAVQRGALLVEVHFAFAEPKAWFDGAPILRSKLSVVTQDQIRRLRRELAKQRKD